MALSRLPSGAWNLSRPCYGQARAIPSRSRVQPRAKSHVLIRNASSATPLEHEFIVHVPDLSGTLPIRLKTKQLHIKGAMPKIESGHFPYFGVTLSQHPQLGESPSINGSVIVIKARDEQSIREILEQDPYTKAGVWDVKNSQIWAFKSG